MKEIIKSGKVFVMKDHSNFVYIKTASDQVQASLFPILNFLFLIWNNNLNLAVGSLLMITRSIFLSNSS